MLNDKIEYNMLPGRLAAACGSFLDECSELYSNHYGIWGAYGARPGQSVRLSSDKIREWLENDNVTIYYASYNAHIIGYAIAFSKNEYGYGVVTWVTQLVVHKDFRHKGIAKNILFSIWGFSNHFAWGIVSANPYAIRALEKATRRRAVPVRIKRNATKLKNIGKENVPFIHENTEFNISKDCSKVNTKFYVEHSDTIQKIADVTNDDVPWNLGEIEEGWEWFAFTFNDQDQISLSKEEIENMVVTSDSVVHKAYSKMNLDVNTQKWMKNTVSEIEYINKKINLASIDFAYDLGCGVGRHAIELAKRGIEVIGIDYVEENIEAASKKIQESSLHNIQVLQGDCRDYKNSRKAMLVTCLYDVIGTFSTNEENKQIILTAYNLLKENGYAVFSVMNYETTLANAKNLFTFSTEANRLLELEASDTMERTGNIFNSRYYLVDTETHLVYRKEQFSSGQGLPVELIVRDKRFTKDEIVTLCEEVGFSVLEVKYTNASGWEREYGPTDERAKEILLIC